MKRARNKVSGGIHFVWTTLHRFPKITEDIERDLYRYITKVCQDDGCTVLALNGMPDHVHLLIALPLTTTIPKLMKDIKGGSSRFVAQELKNENWVGWQEHYGAFAVSSSHLRRICAYVENQKLHHAKGDLLESAEEANEEYEID